MDIGYVNVHVSDFARAVAFFEDTLGLEKQTEEAAFGYASFRAGPVHLGIAEVKPDDPAASTVGQHTGIGFMVEDAMATYEELNAKGVKFTMVPVKQPWGGFMGLFADPDGNEYYLDQIIEH